MSDELHDLVHATSDEAPRPEFVAELRGRLRDEMSTDRAASPELLEGNDDEADPAVDDITIVLHDQTSAPPGTTRMVRFLQTAAAAAVIGVVALAWVLFGASDDESGLDTVNVPEELVEDTPTTTVASGPENSEASDLETGPIALTPASSSFIDPGAYETSLVGTTVTFSTSRELRFGVNGAFQIAVPGTEFNSDRTLLFERISALPSPGALSQSAADFSWPVDDVSGWSEEFDDDVLLAGPEEVVVGGQRATRVEFQIGEFGCGRESGCVIGGDGAPGTRALFREGARYRLWVVDQASEDPLLLLAGIDDPADVDWFTEVDRIVESIELGEPRPNPVRFVDATELNVQAFGEITLSVPDETIVYEPSEHVASVSFPEENTYLSFFASPIAFDGQPIATIQQLEERFEEELIQPVERGSVDLDGMRFVSFDFGDNPSDGFATRLFVLDQSENRQDRPGWFASGSWWVAEDPELGLLIIEAVGISGVLFPDERDFVDSVLSSLEFDERR